MVGCFLHNLNALQSLSKYEQLFFKALFFFLDRYCEVVPLSFSGFFCVSFLFVEDLIQSRPWARCLTFMISTILQATLGVFLLFPFHSGGSWSSESVSHPGPLLGPQLLSERARIWTQIPLTIRMGGGLEERPTHYVLITEPTSLGRKSHLLHPLPY